MKAYTNYRVALFIGLLGFNTLSACVHARQTLGVNNRRNNNGKCLPNAPVWVKRCLAVLFGVGGVVYVVRGLSHYIGNHGMIPSTNNGTNGTSFGPFIPITTTVTPE